MPVTWNRGTFFWSKVILHHKFWNYSFDNHNGMLKRFNVTKIRCDI